MDIEKLIEQVNARGLGNGTSLGYHSGLFDEAATALSMLQAENEKLREELEQVKRERYVAIEYLREIEWCAGCKHFGGLDGCKKWAMGQCTEKHALYEFVGPQKED